MEAASADDFPEDAERKGIGTPATRAAIIEKLVLKGFLERKGSGKGKDADTHRKRESLNYRNAGAAPVPCYDSRLGGKVVGGGTRRICAGNFHR